MTPKTSEIGVQTDASQPCCTCHSSTKTPHQNPGDSTFMQADDNDISSSEDDDDGHEDDDYIPSDVSSNAESDILAKIPEVDPQDDVKYIVFWTSILELFKFIHCSRCGELDLTMHHNVSGTMLLVAFTCRGCGYKTRWNSQPKIGSTPAGNILLSSAIITSGAIATKILRLFGHMNVASIAKRTFFRHQRHLLFPTVKKIWLDHQTWIIAALQADQRYLVVGGDGRHDSPGHSAKFCSYTMIEMVAKVIIDTQLVQVNK